MRRIQPEICRKDGLFICFDKAGRCSRFGFKIKEVEKKAKEDHAQGIAFKGGSNLSPISFGSPRIVPGRRKREFKWDNKNRVALIFGSADFVSKRSLSRSCTNWVTERPEANFPNQAWRMWRGQGRQAWSKGTGKSIYRPFPRHFYVRNIFCESSLLPFIAR